MPEPNPMSGPAPEPPPQRPLYRLQALDRLNSSDQLDSPLIVPHSAAAIAAAGLAVLAATLVIWLLMVH
jgi:hypothetical protein